MHAEASASWILQKLHFITGGGGGGIWIALPRDAESHDFKDARFARLVWLVFFMLYRIKWQLFLRVFNEGLL